MKVKVESEKIGLKLNIQKTKIMASGPITSWQINGNSGRLFSSAPKSSHPLPLPQSPKDCSIHQTLFFWAPKSLQIVTTAMKLIDAYSLEGKL